MRLSAGEKKEGRKRRGEIGENDLFEYQSLSDGQLIMMLNDHEAKRRTIAATLLGNRRCVMAVDQLCQTLRREKALYVRLAVAEALSKIGEPAILPLVHLLGEIGRNQEKELPNRCCEKESYPLVRDLAGRILVKIGAKAITSLSEILFTGKPFQIEQAIDSLGAIAYQTGEHSALESLIKLMDCASENAFLKWKITRSLGGFRNEKAIKQLILILNHAYEPALRWEAARSLGQIVCGDDSILIELKKAAQQDPDHRVSRAALQAIKHIKAE